MIVRVVCVGRPGRLLGPGIREYEERAARYWKLEMDEVSPGRGGTGPAGASAVMEDEAKGILRKVGEEATVVALTRSAKGMTSAGLARYLERRTVASAPEVAFVVGGAHGLAPSVLERAQRSLSLSPMTLPHDLARLVLVEQLFRAGTILRGEPYHKGRP